MTESHPVISATAVTGLRIQTAQGKPATLAVIDGHGNVLDSGQELADDVFDVIVECYRRFLIGESALRVLAVALDASHDKSHAPTGDNPADTA